MKHVLWLCLVAVMALGACTREPKVDKGDQGDIGPQGPQGIPGPAGLAGHTGQQGPAGPTHWAGDAGTTAPINRTGLASVGDSTSRHDSFSAEKAQLISRVGTTIYGANKGILAEGAFDGPTGTGTTSGVLAEESAGSYRDA